MVDIDLIRRKLSRLNMYLEKLKPISEKSLKEYEDYSISFIKAAEAGLISRDLAESIKGSAGMRNILVHEYMDIDDEKVYYAIPLAIKGYKEYIKQVEEFVEKIEEQ